MRRLKKIAIIGRPNVGKSALFNRIVGKRISIVDAKEGVTRDRIYGTSTLFGTPFELIDTGGLVPSKNLPFQTLVEQQTQVAIDEADAIIFVVDGQVGVTTLDEHVAKQIKPLGLPITLAVNKIDAPSQEFLLSSFYSLGIKSTVPVSAHHGLYIAELLESVLSLEEDNKERIDVSQMGEEGLSVAIIGRPNVGKSTMLNSLLVENRSLVSKEAGTTRDAIDAQSTFEGTLYHWIDTAGIRKKRGEKEVVDKYAAIRTKEAIERSSVCLILLDASSGLQAQDKKILTQVQESGKGCVLFFNKWDLVSGYQIEPCIQQIHRESPFTKHCPILFGSAKTKQRLSHIFPLLQKVHANWTKRIPTGELNQFLTKTIQQTPPPMQKGKRLRIYYATQVGVAPPKITLFINSPSLITPTYEKYLLNQLRASYSFSGTPVFFYFRKKESSHPRKKER